MRDRGRHDAVMSFALAWAITADVTVLPLRSAPLELLTQAF